MVSIEKIYRTLVNDGYNVERVTVSNIGGTGRSCAALRVDHGYIGMYPDESAIAAARDVSRIARGLYTERRGHGSSTFIFNLTPTQYAAL